MIELKQEIHGTRMELREIKENMARLIVTLNSFEAKMLEAQLDTYRDPTRKPDIYF